MAALEALDCDLYVSEADPRAAPPPTSPAAPARATPAAPPRANAPPPSPSLPGTPLQSATPGPAAPSVPPRSPDASAGIVPDVPPKGRTPHRRRALLDLFPPLPGEAAAVSPGEAAVASSGEAVVVSPGEAPAPPALPAATPQTGRPSPRSPARSGPADALDAFKTLGAFAPRVDETITYETFYGLNEKPFSLSSDPKFLYHSTAHDRVAQELLSAIRRRDALVVITGESGMGKTMLCRAVMDQLDRRTLTSFVPDPSVSINELLKTILIDFGVITRADAAGGGLARASRADLGTALREFMGSLATLQAFAVVLIDEAQDLSIDALKEIRRLSEGAGQGEERLLQFVLVGQPTLLRLLRRSRVRMFAERASVRCALEPLPADEMVDYVLYRLSIAGTDARIEFEDQAFARLNDYSGGVPRLINLLCDRALTFGRDASASVIDGLMIERAADDLDIRLPLSQASRLARAAMSAAALLALMLAGAGAGVLVFHDRVAQVIVRWQAVPAPPRRPPLPLPAPPVPRPLPPEK